MSNANLNSKKGKPRHNDTGKKAQRDVNLDLIRCVALFLLPSLHFFLNSGFYDLPVSGWVMYIMISIRTMSMMCIPLFLMLTGYLMSKKQYGPGYFNGLIRILSIFFIYKLIAIALFSKFYLHAEVTFVSFIQSLTSGGEYSWYVSMYAWLYCIIPLLNIIFDHFGDKRQKQAFLLAIIALFILPSFGNYYKGDMPDVFHAMWPIAYYYIGAYVREYHQDAKKSAGYTFSLFLGAVLLNSLINILVSWNIPFVWNTLNDWYSFGIAMMASSLFIFLRKLNLQESMPRVCRLILAKVSEWSFGAYLFSWIFDQAFYPKLAARVPDAMDRIPYYLIMVLAVLICAIALSAVVNAVYKGLDALIRAIFAKPNSGKKGV